MEALLIIIIFLAALSLITKAIVIKKGSRLKRFILSVLFIILSIFLAIYCVAWTYQAPRIKGQTERDRVKRELQLSLAKDPRKIKIIPSLTLSVVSVEPGASTGPSSLLRIKLRLANPSPLNLSNFKISYTIEDCRDEKCLVVHEEVCSAVIVIPSKQTREFEIQLRSNPRYLVFKGEQKSLVTVFDADIDP